MSILLQQLTKRYDGHPVVNDVSLEIADGEFFVLLGSSGSGKTTVLSMIAGLTAIDEGRVLLHGRDVTHLPTQERNVGYVFQNYALFQHMTVADNIEFGLRVRKVPTAQRRKRRMNSYDFWRNGATQHEFIRFLAQRRKHRMSSYDVWRNDAHTV